MARQEQAAILSFMIDGAHPTTSHHLSTNHGVAVRAGHHCASRDGRYGIPGTVRLPSPLQHAHTTSTADRSVGKVREIFK
jgi:cysteine desulfurase/selenocysteine lyase